MSSSKIDAGSHQAHTGKEQAAGDAATAEGFSQINRSVLVTILCLALAFVLVAILGARFVFTQAARQPVSMADVPAPQAESSECSSLIDSLPSKLLGHRRAELADPAPAGAAAWRSSSTEQITLRCGVDAPLQYTDYSETEGINGTQWLRVNDAASDSTIATWFSVNRSPIVAVTADNDALGGASNPVADIDVSALPEVDAERRPAPLSDLAPGDAATCGGLEAAAPEEIAPGYQRFPVAQDNTIAWASPGNEPVVLRCGVADPADYRAGAQLIQVDAIAWFQDSEAGNGVTADTWYALGRKAMLAASIPAGSGNEIITNLSRLIDENVPAN